MNDDNIKKEKKLTDSDNTQKASDSREKIEPVKKHETMEEKAKREGWTDTAESHLGIDE